MKAKLTLLTIAAFSLSSFAGSVNLSSLTNAESVASCLAQYPYADTNITSFTEFDFAARRDVICAVLKNDSLVVSTNVLFAIADYLSIGTFIPTSNYHNEIVAAHKYDRFVEFGDSNHVVRAGSAHLGPRARACRQQYEYRNAYNYDLRDFKQAILKEIYKRLSSPSWQSHSPEERNEMWSDLLRRANPSAEEHLDLPILVE